MTYKELAEQINKMTLEQQNLDVTVYARELDEYYSLVSDYPLCFADSNIEDVLDEKHPYLVI